MDTKRSSLTDQALDLSRDMITAIREDRWDRLGDMERQRERILAELIDGADGIAPPDWTAALLEIQRLGDELLSIAQAERARIAQELLALRGGRKAQTAYAATLDATTS